MSKANRLLEEFGAIGSFPSSMSGLLGEQDKPKAIICDLDGCLAPTKERFDYIKNNDWEGFRKAGLEVEPSQWCLEILKRFQGDYQILIVSARPAEELEETKKWLDDKCKLEYKIFLRANKDQLDHEYKPEIYNKEIKDNYDVLFVIDDRPKVVAAWRALGLVCLQPEYTEVK